jgi:hypothetical protein
MKEIPLVWSAFCRKKRFFATLRTTEISLVILNEVKDLRFFAALRTTSYVQYGELHLY